MPTFLPHWLTLPVVLAASVPFIGGLLSIGAELLLGKKRRRARLKRNLILLGGALGILGALIAAFQQDKDSYELLGASTGGDGYCYLHYVLNTSVAMKFAAMCDSDLPAYDVSMEITDLTHWHEILSQDPQASAKLVNPDNIFAWDKETKVDLALGNFRPHEVRWVWEAPFPKSELQSYYVSVLARNGLVEQELLLHSGENGTFVAASRIWRRTANPAKGQPKIQVLTEGASDEFRKYYPNGIPWTPNLGQ